MEVAFQTAIGRQRENNQDYVDVFQNTAGLHLAVVADGIGGHSGGDVASAMAVSHLGHQFTGTDFSVPKVAQSWVRQQIRHENQSIIDKSHQFPDLSGMGTTLVAAIYSDREFLIVNIGDSRAYRFRHARLEQLTEDHSLVNELVKRGELSRQDAQHHPQKNVIIRSLGVTRDADLDAQIYPFGAHDQVLLCSDGLTNMMSDDQIAEILGQPLSIQDKCDVLIKQANAAGGLDNITVLIIAVGSEVVPHA